MWQKCPVCNGGGTAYFYKDDSGIPYKQVPCPVCEGKGEVSKEKMKGIVIFDGSGTQGSAGTSGTSGGNL